MDVSEGVCSAGERAWRERRGVLRESEKYLTCTWLSSVC